MATRFTPQSALITARIEQAQHFRDDAYDRHKHSSNICLHNGNLDHAIWHTQVALFMARIRRVS